MPTERLSSNQVESSLHTVRIDSSSERLEDSRVDESLGSVVGLRREEEWKSAKVEFRRRRGSDSLERQRRERSGHVFELRRWSQVQRRSEWKKKGNPLTSSVR